MRRSQSAPLHVRLAPVTLLFLTSLFAVSCGEYTGGEGDSPNVDRAVAGTGLDAPPTPVGPFLDDAFPPRTPNAASSTTWDVVEAFPNVTFNQTLAIATSPNPNDDRLYVGSRDGNIFSIEYTPNVSVSEPFMDIRDRVAVVWDGGFLGLAFHPEFGVSGSPYETAFYVYYSSYCPTTFDGQNYVNDFNNCNPGYPTGSTGDFFNTWLRLSRFDAYFDSVAGVWRGDSTTEQPLLNIRLYNGSHRGGGPVFGHDDLLYVMIGDQFRYETAQDIVGNFEGGSIRVAVDVTDNGDGTWTCPPGSHQPIRKMQDVTSLPDEMTGQYYCIPDDNPWLDTGGGLFEEFYSIGHRNPHRVSVDTLTGRIWSGEVGQSTREEVNVILKGRNYQWPYMEGLTTGVRPPPTTILGIEQPPVIDFVRADATTIIGGYVYRGTKFPELYGKYIAGDYSTDNVWAITLDEGTMTATEELLTTFSPGGLATFGQGKDGEVYLGDVFGTQALYTLDRVGGPVPEPPATLSALGAFQDTASMQLKDYWVPYDLNQPFWSDGAEKFRWIALPNDGTRDTPDEQILYSETGTWGYPVGTVIMKHFELVLDENDPTDRTRLETRYLVLGDDFNWYGVTYLWRPDQLDADLLDTFAAQDYTIALAGGGTRDQTWYFPSRQECMGCHLQVSGGALGLNARQQNGDLYYPSTGRTDNQLVTWNHLGMFSPAIDEATLPTMLRSVPFADVTASLEDRARSWLDSNCGYCHRPGGVNAGFDARLTTPFESQGMVYGGVRNDLGVPGLTVLTPGEPDMSAIYLRAATVGPTGMPPLAKTLAQTPAVEILGEWIRRVDPNLAQNGINYEYYEPGDVTVLPGFDSLTPVATGTVNAFDISVRQQDDYFAFRFTSLLYVDLPGDYTFYTSSDDGSQLFIDNQLVVDNDGLHGVQEQSGVVTLGAGYHPIRVTMFERTGGEALTVNWQGPDTGGVKGQIAIGRLFLQQPTLNNDPPTLIDPGPQQYTVGESVLLTLQATDPNGDFLYYDAAGLPPGLTLDHETGDITGLVTAAAIGAYDVTTSASDQNLVSVASSTWVVSALPGCGDGVLDAGEDCDDGNLTDGDGCTSACVIEFCGDGVINNNGAETCEPPNSLVCDSNCMIIGGTSCSSDLDCDDGDVCTDDQCDPGTSTCLYDYIAMSCDDLNACTVSDVCNEGVCIGGNLAAGCTSCQGIADIPANGGIFFGSITSGPGYLSGSCGATANSAERVYRWIPDASGPVTIETCGPETDYDTAMYVRSDACETGGEIDCNDDTDGCAVNDGRNNAHRHGSRVQFDAEQGREYFVVVSGYNGRNGNYKLTVSPSSAPPPPGSVCGNGIAEAGEECDGADASSCATGQCQGTGDSSPCSCVLPGTAPDLVSTVDDLAFEFDTTVPSEDVAEGCATATSGIDILRFRTITENIGNADFVLGDPDCPFCPNYPDAACGNPNFVCAPAGGHGHEHYDNFARFDLIDSVTRAVVATTHKRGFCLRDSSCTTGTATYDCGYQGISAGCRDTYRRTLGCQFIEVTDVPGGQYELHVIQDPFGLVTELNEANNTTVVPITLVRGGGEPGAITEVSPLGGVYPGFTSGESMYAGSCKAGPTGGSPEQVFSLTPTTSGTYTAQTCGQNTTFDTVMYVREGSPTAPDVGCNDDTDGCGVNDGSTNAYRHGSVVSFDATAGQTYYIIVDAYSNSGPFELTLTRPDGGLCGDGTWDGPEECDGADDAACPGECQADCSCGAPPPNVCGDGAIGGIEECDGADDSVCPGLCQSDCTCAPAGPICGDGTQETGEACDGADDAACPGLCLHDCTCAPSTATTNTLVAVKDNTLFESALGDLSNGAGDHLFAGRTGADTLRRALLAFDVAGGIPAGSVIHGAKLRMHMSRTVAGALDVTVHRVNADWGEGISHANGEEGGGAPPSDGDVTWLHTHYDSVNPTGSPTWTTPGGDFMPGESATTSVAGQGHYSWFSQGLVTDVQAWLDNPASNFGWAVIADEQMLPSAKRFDSREHFVPANWPELVVYFSPPSSSWGACCATDGSCGFALDETDCASQGGTYQGDSTVCSPNPCPPPPDFCGNGILGPGEECEVGNDAACPGLCQGDCTCAPPPTCGDGVVNQAQEDCDGADDAACPGACQVDCTCPPVPTCGDGIVNQAQEDCDGADDAACPGSCQVDCTCPPPPTCGDGIVNQAQEDCDGADDAACPGLCQVDCTCAPAPTCGDGIVNQAQEMCDGADDAACPGACQVDCTCPPAPFCGDGILNQPQEQCEVGQDAACPGLCQGDCTCAPPPVCGNGVFETGEQCDGTDDAACPGLCQVDCTCGNALPPDGGVISGVTSGESAFAGTCGNSGSAPEEVYTLTPLASGTYTLETCSPNTTYDTIVYVREGSTQGNEVVCNDDTAGCGVNDGTSNASKHGSRVTFDAIEGQTYFVFVDGHSTKQGAFELVVIAPTGPPPPVCGDGVTNGTEECDGADDAACPGACRTDCTCGPPVSDVIPSEGGVISGSVGGPSQLQGCTRKTVNHPEKVLTWTPTTSGTVTMETCSLATDFDTVVYINQGAVDGPQVACNDDTTGCAVGDGTSRASKHGSRVTFSYTAGETYYVIVDGHSPSPTEDPGVFDLTVIP